MNPPIEPQMSEETRNHFILMTKYVEGIDKHSKKTMIVGWVIILAILTQFLVIVYGVILLTEIIPSKVVVALTDYEFILTE